MPPSMYDLTVPVFLHGLSVLSSYLDKAADYATTNNINPTVLITARLFPDMQSLAGQVQRASDAAKSAMARLTGAEMPRFDDTETTFEELQARIAKTAALLRTIDPKHLEGSESRTTTMALRGTKGILTGQTYLLQITLPNFFFHITTAHDILRHNGLKIGKADYFGALDYTEITE